MRNIVYVHGAGASPVSFTYVKSQMKKHNSIDFTYDVSDSIDDNVDRLVSVIPDNAILIGHSFGGILSVSASNIVENKVHSVITMSTPFGGSETAYRMSFIMPFSPFINNISTSNSTLKQISRLGTPVPLLRFITTEGQSAFEPKANDGVVTVESQEAINDNGLKIYVPLNHFEVLLDKRVTNDINTFITGVDKARRKAAMA